jgi:ElaB/YqjD/DUF883 family membrane-anchored ribosome-binding protein
MRSTWSEAGERLNSLGSSLKAHYARQRGEEAEHSREELNAAVRKLTTAVQDAFEAVGSAAKDPEVKDEVKKVGQSVGQALGVTFNEVSEDLRKAFSQRKGDVGQSPSTGAGPSATAGPAATAAPAATAPPTPPAPADPDVGPQQTSGGQASGRSDGEEPPRVEPWGTP